MNQSDPTDRPILISDGTARRIAAERFHATAAARAFADTGEVRPELLADLDAALAADEAQHELKLLRRYVEAAGARGPRPGW